MWFLECDGPLLGGKSVWLRPGSSHLFGRTRGDANSKERVQFIDSGSVSRKHLVLTIDPVTPGDSAHLHIKTKLTLTDESKLGTSIDGEKVVKRSRVLDRKQHVVKLGNYDVLFRIKWKPVILSFTSLSRAQKQADDPLTQHRARLESLGIKCITEYVTQYTTHVVAKKRNTAAVLQALVNGRHIVTDAFVEAIEGCSRPEGEDGRSLLEQDFDANWPKEIDFLPDPSAEPHARPPHDPSFSPNPERAEVFSRYIFVFCDAAQYETLLPVVTGGGGKALLREVDEHGDAMSMVAYVREVAGKKGNAAFKLSQQPAKGGVVVVRAGDKAQAGGLEFWRKLDLTLDQRSMEQNEFLEAILEMNASSLKRALEEEIVDGESEVQESHPRSEARSQPAASESLHQEANAPQTDIRKTEASSQPSPMRRKGRRVITQSRFLGFDDFDEDSVPKHQPSSPPTQRSHEQNTSASRNGRDFSPSQPVSDREPTPPVTQPKGKKRAAPPLEPVQTRSEVLDGYMTSAAMVKRRRLEERAERGELEEADRGEVAPKTDTKAATMSKTQAQKKHKGKELDVLKTVQKRREQEDLNRDEDETYLRTALEGMDVNSMRPAVVEEMDLLRHSPARATVDATGINPRWKPEWNGRPNWKKFTRSRQGNQTAADGDETGRLAASFSSSRRVLVSVEPHKPKTYGMGDDYWLEPTDRTTTQKSQGHGKSQDRSQTLGRDDGETAVRAWPTSSVTSASRNGTQNKGRKAPAGVIDLSDDSLDEESDDTVAPISSRATRRNGESHANSADRTQRSIQTLVASGQSASSRKRAAPTPAASAKTKKQRQTRAGDFDEEDEDDGLKFRRRRG